MRRIVAIVVAVALAAIGTVLLVGYVRNAEERALEGETLVSVLVLDEAVERGAPAEELVDAVHAEQVPLKVRAEDSVASLRDLTGLVAAVDLVPGEQILASRFTDPATLVTHARVEAPSNLLEVTVSLAPDRAVGGQLIPGDAVAVIASFDPFEISAVEPGDPESVDAEGVILVGSTGDEDDEDNNRPLKTPNSTHLILHQVLVTNVQVEQAPRVPEEGSPTDAPELAPTGNLLITLAVRPGDAEKVIFTAEHGFLWLAAEGPDVDQSETVIQTRGTIYR